MLSVPSFIILISSIALPYARLMVLLLVHCCCTRRVISLLIIAVNYHKETRVVMSCYNSSRGMSYTGGTSRSSTIMLVTVSIGSADDNLSISERDEDPAD